MKMEEGPRLKAQYSLLSQQEKNQLIGEAFPTLQKKQSCAEENSSSLEKMSGGNHFNSSDFKGKEIQNVSDYTNGYSPNTQIGFGNPGQSNEYNILGTITPYYNINYMSGASLQIKEENEGSVIDYSMNSGIDSNIVESPKPIVIEPLQDIDCNQQETENSYAYDNDSKEKEVYTQESWQTDTAANSDTQPCTCETVWPEQQTTDTHALDMRQFQPNDMDQNTPLLQAGAFDSPIGNKATLQSVCKSERKQTGKITKTPIVQNAPPLPKIHSGKIKKRRSSKEKVYEVKSKVKSIVEKRDFTNQLTQSVDKGFTTHSTYINYCCKTCGATFAVGAAAIQHVSMVHKITYKADEYITIPGRETLAAAYSKDTNFRTSGENYSVEISQIPSDKMSHTCKECSETFDGLNEAFRHISRVHDLNAELSTNEFIESYTYDLQEKVIFKIESSVNGYFCKECDMICWDLVSIDKHVSLHRSLACFDYFCLNCQPKRKFDCLNSVLAHHSAAHMWSEIRIDQSIQENTCFYEKRSFILDYQSGLAFSEKKCKDESEEET